MTDKRKNDDIDPTIHNNHKRQAMTNPTSASTKRYILYGLKGDAGNPKGRLISPHVWKTKLDLAYLGISKDVDEEYKTFPQIRNDLADLTKNPVVTVPTLRVETGDGEGKYVTDSWKIAEYLEGKYGSDDKSLFGSNATEDGNGKEFAKFIEIWSNTSFANELRPLIASVIVEQFDAASNSYFIDSKFSSDETKYQALIDRFTNPDELQAQLAGARRQLSLIETYLSTKKRDGDKEGIWLIGNSPSHADFCLFGWYATSILHPHVERGVWRNEELPLVGRWLDGLLDSGLVQKDQLKVEYGNGE